MEQQVDVSMGAVIMDRDWTEGGGVMQQGVGVRLNDQDISDVYERLSLAHASDRAKFNAFAPQVPKVAFDVVISTSSEPFAK